MISKQAVLEIIEKEKLISILDRTLLYRKINALPSISDGWISVEKPPKDMDEVLVLDSGDIIGTAVYSSDKKLKGQKCWFNVHAQKWVGDITDWQPLPQKPQK